MKVHSYKCIVMRRILFRIKWVFTNFVKKLKNNSSPPKLLFKKSFRKTATESLVIELQLNVSFVMIY